MDDFYVNGPDYKRGLLFLAKFFEEQSVSAGNRSRKEKDLDRFMGAVARQQYNGLTKRNCLPRFSNINTKGRES